MVEVCDMRGCGVHWAKRHVISTLLIVYGAVNGVFYASLLPLWEGFDEPFHYGYVEVLSFQRILPVSDKTQLTAEIWNSLRLVPVSHIVQRNLPGLMTFSEYFSLPQSSRTRMRSELEAAPHQPLLSSPQGNYEAHQAPLAYALLAGPNRVWRQEPLPMRVWRLRVICAVGSAVLTGLAALVLMARLQVPLPFRHATLFLVFSSQMFYASTAHICNDWLAIPLASLFLYSAIVFYQAPGGRTTVGLGGSLAAGLLTKAYFLSFVPLTLGLVVACVVRRKVTARLAALLCLGVLTVSGPWYARNLVLYGSLSGMQETLPGMDTAKGTEGPLDVPWLSALANTAHWTLWSSNNSSTTFSHTTVDLLLLLLALAGLFYARAAIRSRPSAPEWILIAGCALFAAGLAYSTALNYRFTRGACIGTAPWYVEAVVPPAFCLLACGLARGGLPGRGLMLAIAGLWAYVMAATYIAKLVPLYTGYGEGPARVGPLVTWYIQGYHETSANIAALCLAKPAVIWALLFVVPVATIALLGLVAFAMRHSGQPGGHADLLHARGV